MCQHPLNLKSINAVSRHRDLVLVSHGFQSNYERGFANGVAAGGVKATLISSDQTDISGLHNEISVLNLRGSQIEARSKLTKIVNLLIYHWRLMVLVARERPIVHVFGLIYPAFLCGVIEGLLFKCVSPRYVLTAHDLLPHDSHTRWNRFIFGLAYRLADRVVVHTDKMKADLMRMYHVKFDRVVVMEHGIEPLGTETYADAPKLADAPYQILFFGKVARYKGLDILLEALGKLPLNFNLLIAGRCLDQDLERELKQAIAVHPNVGRIGWRFGHIPDADIPDLFGAADVVVLPYRHIDQSGVLFQSLRFGVPIVAARVGSLAQYVTEEVGETFDSGDVIGLSHALLRAHERRSEFGRDRIRAIARCFEWPQTARVLLPIYAMTDKGAA